MECMVLSRQHPCVERKLGGQGARGKAWFIGFIDRDYVDHIFQYESL